MDRIQAVYFRVGNWCVAMPDETYAGLMRITLIVVLATCLTKLAFRRGNTSSFIQVLCFVVAVLVGFTLRFPSVPHNPDVRCWTVVLAVLVLAILPGTVLPLMLSPYPYYQRKLRWLLWGLVLLGLFATFL